MKKDTYETQIEKLKKEGLFGSVEDPMWNGKLHECCGSPRPYYHRKGCPLCVGELKLRPEYLKSMKNDAGNEVRFNKHRLRKNNDIVAAMYAMYLLPKSLEEVGKVYRKTRQAVYDVFRSRGYMLRSKQYKGLQILDGIRFTETKGGHLRGTLNKKRIMMHHYVWQKHKGPIPEKHCIWHIDRNPANNNIDNLAILPMEMMSVYFNPEFHNQYTKK